MWVPSPAGVDHLRLQQEQQQLIPDIASNSQCGMVPASHLMTGQQSAVATPVFYPSLRTHETQEQMHFSKDRRNRMAETVRDQRSPWHSILLTAMPGQLV